MYRTCWKMIKAFQSTQPEWAATQCRCHSTQGILRISIHAARVGCDTTRPTTATRRKDFNPRSPSGLRQHFGNWPHSSAKFQSTQPEWAATVLKACNCVKSDISIHAARVGCDCSLLWKIKRQILFQSTQPEWAATE